MSQGQLFRIQAVVAIVAALGVLAFPKRWPAWLFAAVVTPVPASPRTGASSRLPGGGLTPHR